MDEQVIDDLYNRAKGEGYSKSRNEFITLLHNDSEVFNDMYSYVKSQGYQKDVNAFSALVGKGGTPAPAQQPAQQPQVAPAPEEVAQPTVEKKSPSVTTALPVAASSSAAPLPPTEAPKEAPKEKKSKQGYFMNTVSALDKGFLKNFIGNPIKGLGTLIEGGGNLAFGKGRGKGPISDALIQFGDYFNKTIDELTPQDEEFKNSLTDQFSQAFGQVASLVATAGGAGLVGKSGSALSAAKTALAAQAAPKAVTTATALKTIGADLLSPTAVSGGLSMGQAEFDRAKEAGATDEQAFEAFYKNAAVGSVLEKIPVMQFMKRFNKAATGGVANYLKTKGVAGLTGGIEEMTTEVIQQLYSNKTAQDIYNTNQELFEGVGESGGVGFGVGFLLNAMGANAKLLRKQGKDVEADVVEAQMKQLEGRAEKGGVSSYSINGITIQPIANEDGDIEEPNVIISNLIDNMNAADLAKANIEIKNDPELKLKLHDKIVSSSIKEQVRESNPDLTEEQLDEIANLEKELRKFEGNTTQSGKDKAASIRSQIKSIQESPSQEKKTEPAKAELPEEISNLQDDENVVITVKTLEEVPEQFKDRANKLEGMKVEIRNSILGIPIGKKTSTVVNDGYRYQITGKEAKDYAIQQQLKQQQDAIQKQSTNESVLLTEQPQLGLQEVVEGNEKPQETTVTPEGTQEVTPEFEQKTDDDIEKRMAEIEGDSASQKEFNALEKEMEKRERGSVFNVALNKINEAIDALMQKEKTKPNGYGVFIEKRDARETKEVADRYLNAKELTDAELKKDFSDSLRGNPTTWYADGLRLRESLKEASNRGIDTKQMIEEAVKVYTNAGYDIKTAKSVVENMLKPIFEGTQEVTPTVTPEVVSEVTFEGKRGQADSITFDGKTIKQGEEIDLNDVNISQDDTMPDLRSGKYKVRMLSVDANGKTATLTLTDGNEVITTTVKDLRNSELKKASLAPEGKPKTALQEATEKRKAAKALLKSLKEGMGLNQQAKLEALVKYHKALVNEAKEFIKEKVNDINAWADSIGEKVDKILQTAWDEATDKIAPIEKGEDLDYTFEEIFRNDIESLPDYNDTMLDIEFIVDEAYKPITYLKAVLERAKAYHKKNNSEASKRRLDKAKAELEEYEGYFEESKDEAIDFLKKSKLYKNATDPQKELLVRDVLSRFGERQKKAPSAEKILGKKAEEKTVLMTEKEALIKQLKDLSRGGKDAAKTIKEVTTNIAKTLKDLQTKGELTVPQVNKILGKLAKVNMLKEESVNKFIDDITEVFEETQEAKTAKDKKTIINKILDLVNKKAKTKILASGKRRSRGLDADGQLFFQSVREVLNAAAANDTNKMMDIMTKLASRQAEIDDAVQKEMRGEPLTLDETILLNEVMAFDTFGDMLNMSVDEIETLYDSLKDVRAESIKRLKDKRIESAAKKASMELEANDNIQEGFGVLFNVDGTLKGKNKLDQDHDNIYKAFKQLKIWDGMKKYLERYDFNNKNFITNFFRNKIANIGTIANILDKKGDLFKRFVYDKLNSMNEKKLVGIESQTKLLDTLANKIFGTKKDGYQKLKYKLAGKGTKDIILNGDEYTFNYGQLLRIYALSLNRVQRKKLNDMGFTEAKINEIKTALGPEFVEFADGIVEYLSTDYFGTVNDVYRKVNDVNLNQIENYFPTKTVSKEANADLLQKGDFNGIFNAETSPAFKERLDKTSPIDLKPSFTDVLDNHLETMEMYKSHAEGVKEMNTFFNIESVKTLLDQTGLGPVLKFNVNNSISPNAGAPIKAKGMDKIINSFTPFALAFKAMQFVKQATSIGAAYGDYSFRANKKTFLLDLPFWIADVAKVIATPRANIKKFKNISATFKERYESGLKGDIISVETGGRTFLPSSQKNTLLGKFKRGFKSAAGFATFAGDILSTFGYMANYNRDIKNGMNPEKALQKFNDYNATLQTKRPSEKSAIQHNQDFIARTVTMFGSSGLLMMNTVSQSTKNILRSISKSEAPKTKDIRKLVFAVGVGNALFIAASNAFKLGFGDEEDKEEAKQDIFEALIGLNLIEQIPLIGDAVELAKSKIKGERFYESSGTNPFLQLGKKMYKIYEEEQGNIIKALRPIAEAKLGFQFEPFMGLINSTVEGEVNEDDMYDMLGVAKSYRPTGEEEQEVKAEKNVKEEDTTSKELESLQELINTETDADIINEAVKRIEYLRMDDDEKKQYKKERKEEVKADKAEVDALLGEYDSKDEMRRYDKALYEKTFGEGSDYYKKNEAKSKMEAKVRELEEKAEDKERGFSEPVKEKKSKRNSDGSYKRTYKRTYKSSYKRSYQSGN